LIRWPIWSATEELTYQGYIASRLAAFSRHRWLAYCLVGIVWAPQYSFISFIPDRRLVLYRCLAFLPSVLVYMAIYLRTRRLAPLIIAHWMVDLTAVFMTFPSETGRTKRIALAKYFLRGQFSFSIVVAYILTEPGCTLPLAPPA
jgi:membrane protease YdiL (CAAX protease family)